MKVIRAKEENQEICDWHHSEILVLGDVLYDTFVR